MQSPEILTRVSRRFGRNDYEDFRPIGTTTSPICVGKGEVGKVVVHCHFLFTKSRWGVLGPNKAPGGILHIDIDFEQPVDCRIKSATILITLEEGAQGVSPLSPTRPSGEAVNPTNFTDCYGPKDFGGKPKLKQRRKRQDWKPRIKVLGNEIGGVGLQMDETTQDASRWTFSGHLQTKPGSSNGVFDILKWKLEENQVDTQSLHSNTFHTAFAISHNGSQFRIKVQVEGKLDERSRRFKHWASKTFTSKGKRDEAGAVTLVDFGRSYDFTHQLDREAESLPLAMQLKNLHRVPVEVEDSLPVNFYEDTPRDLSVLRPRSLSGRRPAVNLTAIDGEHVRRNRERFNRNKLLSSRELRPLEWQDPALKQLHELLEASGLFSYTPHRNSPLSEHYDELHHQTNQLVESQAPKGFLFDDLSETASGSEDKVIGDRVDDDRVAENVLEIQNSVSPKIALGEEDDMILLVAHFWMLFARVFLRKLAFALGFRGGEFGIPPLQVWRSVGLSGDAGQREQPVDEARLTNGRNVTDDPSQGQLNIEADLSPWVEDYDGSGTGTSTDVAGHWD